MSKEANFADWYLQVIDDAGIVDKRYPIKGMNVWTPYGLRVMRLMNGFMHDEMARTGHEEMQFPVLVPETSFQKEADHIKGFGGEVYWVTHGGLSELDVRLLLRPTSESAMYDLFALWIRSHTDLPVKIYQIVPTFRYETKQTRTFIRVRELSFFFESHTAHENFDGATAQVAEDVAIWGRLSRKYALPTLLTKRPDWDTFPGAYYTVVPDAYVPEAGRAMQVASMHHYRDNFSQVYGIDFEDADGERQFVHQTTYGMSERILGALIATHGDDRGIVLPPEIAPIQAVIIPILAKGEKARVTQAAKSLARDLEAIVRIELDLRNLRPGAKFYEWERKGVPLRIEIGVEEVQGGTVTFVRRDTGKRRKVQRTEVAKRVPAALNAIQTALFRRAREALEASIHPITTFEEAPRRGVVRAGWCGKESCGLEMEEKLDRNMLGTPYTPEAFEGTCLACGEATNTAAYAARAF